MAPKPDVQTAEAEPRWPDGNEAEAHESEAASEEMRETFSEAMKRLEDLLSLLPGDSIKQARLKLERLRTLMVDQKPASLLLIGRRGAGKSSLINALLGSYEAPVGHVKSETAVTTWYRYAGARGSLDILDTRGVQEGSTPEGATTNSAEGDLLLAVRTQLPDVILFLVKASEVDSAIDADLDVLARIAREVERIHQVPVPIFAVVTHADLVEPKNARLHLEQGQDPEELREKQHRVLEVERYFDEKIRSRGLSGFAQTLAVSTYLSFRKKAAQNRTAPNAPTSSQNDLPESPQAADGYEIRADERWQIDALATMVFRKLPDRSRAQFARLSQVRALQEEIATELVHVTAGAAAAVAAIPIPIADAIPLTSMQVALVGAIAWLGGHRANKETALKFLTAFGANVGAAYTLREAARAMVKFIFPGAGSAISAVVAFSGTMAIGKAAQTYFLGTSPLANVEVPVEETTGREDSSTK
jgi:uncharacterized protein